MATTRDELISDWRQRLAAAEETVITSPRSAWLARMQVRLYRFLLACYGSSTWEPAPQSTDHCSAVFDSEEAKSLDGKPARPLSQIRSVLTAVAKAQDESHAPGPLADGLDYDSWVVVAAASSKLKVNQCVALLAKAGLQPRLCQRGDDQTVEVPAHERGEAFDLVERHLQQLHQPPRSPRTQPIPTWGRFAAMAVLALWTTGLLTWALAAVAWSSTGQVSRSTSPLEFLDGHSYLSIWFSLFVVALLSVVIAFLRRQRRTAKASR